MTKPSPPPPDQGGKALFALRGSTWMRRIGAEGGHATVSRYGVGYMAQIGSAGAIKRMMKRGAHPLEEHLMRDRIDPNELDRHITGVYDEPLAESGGPGECPECGGSGIVGSYETITVTDPKTGETQEITGFVDRKCEACGTEPAPDVEDKQEIIEHLLNRRLISDDEATQLAELSLADVTKEYDRLVDQDDPFDWNDVQPEGDDEPSAEPLDPAPSPPAPGGTQS